MTSTYSSGTSWYRIWSDGWIEQGGRITSAGITSITLLKPHKDTNYCIAVAQKGASSNAVIRMSIESIAKNSITIYSTRDGMLPIFWQTCGY